MDRLRADINVLDNDIRGLGDEAIQGERVAQLVRALQENTELTEAF